MLAAVQRSFVAFSGVSYGHVSEPSFATNVSLGRTVTGTELAMAMWPDASATVTLTDCWLMQAAIVTFVSPATAGTGADGSPGTISQTAVTPSASNPSRLSVKPICSPTATSVRSG